MAMNPPTKLGRYEIVEELGRGAMGVVYLAWDPLIGRQVALKVLRMASPTSDDELMQIRRRFIREAQSAGILSHRNIVTIHDVVEESEEQATFIAMEHVRGTDVKQLLKGGAPLDLDFVSEVVGQVADALDYAHSRGVIHRDIKPANILITADRLVKLTDFGIARLGTSSLTQDTQLLGTPNYMAPEQIRGGTLDHRVDIFALGVVLYEMVTGRKPFRGENLTEVTHHIVYEDFTPPTDHVSDLLPGVEKVIRRALEKDPEDRYPTARQLADELAREVTAFDVAATLNETQEVVLPSLEAPPPPPPTPSPAGAASRPRREPPDRAAKVARAERDPSRRRWVLLASGALLATVVLGGLLLLWAAPAAEPPVDPEPEQELQRELVPLVQEGRRLLQEGDPAAAAVKLRMAERLAPERVEIRSWRELAEHQAEAFQRMNQRERELAGVLVEAEIALEERRYQEAIRKAEEVLRLQPGDEETAAKADEIRTGARQALEELERARAEKARAARAAAQAASASGSAPGSAAAPEGGRPPGPVGEPTLEVEFITEEPAGNLTVFLGEERLLNETFRFYEKKGFLGLGAAKPYDGRIYLPPTKVRRGAVTLRVYVTPRGQAARSEILETEFAPGVDHRLAIHFSADGSLTVNLRP